MALCTSATSCFEQEPNTTFGLIDPVLEETRGSDIACLIAKIVHSAHAPDEILLILAKFAQHIARANVVRVIIGESLQARDVSDGPYRVSPDFPYAFGDVICDSKHLIRVLIEEQVVVAEMWPTHVPVEVLCL
jgi:hypothetical protein